MFLDPVCHQSRVFLRGVVQVVRHAAPHAGARVALQHAQQPRHRCRVVHQRAQPQAPLQAWPDALADQLARVRWRRCSSAARSPASVRDRGRRMGGSRSRPRRWVSACRVCSARAGSDMPRRTTYSPSGQTTQPVWPAAGSRTPAKSSPSPGGPQVDFDHRGRRFERRWATWLRARRTGAERAPSARAHRGPRRRVPRNVRARMRPKRCRCRLPSATVRASAMSLSACATDLGCAGAGCPRQAASSCRSTNGKMPPCL